MNTAVLSAILIGAAGFEVFCLVDLYRAAAVRYLPKWAWAGIDPSRRGGVPGPRQGRLAVIEVDQLTKRFGAITALDDLSFTVQPGKVTGFLGPNGAGKSTTMRVILGLDAPTAGRALVHGRQYREIGRPLCQVGSLLDANALHPGRSAWHHLRSVAQSNRITKRRVSEVLQLTGVEAVAQRPVATFSLGMKQRLGIALALLGEPRTLVFDEPVCRQGIRPGGLEALPAALWRR